MAHDASILPKAPTRLPKPRPDGSPEEGVPLVARRRPRRDPVDAVWSLLCSIKFAVVMNVGLAVAAMLGTIVPQMQPGIQNFDTELRRFLTAAGVRSGPLSDVLYWAGFYDLYISLWFRMLVVVVVFGIIACTLNRWQPIMRQISSPTVKVSDTFLAGLSEKAQFRAVALEPGAAREALVSALKGSRYRVLSEESTDGRGIHIYADRDRWSKLVTFVSHAALVL